MQERKAYQRVALELPVAGQSSASLNTAIETDESPVKQSASDLGEISIGFYRKQQQSIRKTLGISFWIAGLLNNAGYVIMIASAKSISEGGVGLVFLANILPALAIKASAPYWFEKVSYHHRLVFATILMVVSFGIVALSKSLVWQLGGVACTSAQGSLGEASLLALAGKMDGELVALEQILTQTEHVVEELEDTPSMSHCHQSSASSTKGVCLNGFSSGTGFAGVFGFFWVWLFSHTLGLSLSATLLLAMVLAGGYLYSYTIISKVAQQRDQIMATLCRTTTSPSRSSIDPSHTNGHGYRDDQIQDETTELDQHETTNRQDTFHDETDNTPSQDVTITTNATLVREISSMSGPERFSLVMSLWPYTVPLFTVYVAEYTLQSGTWTAIGFPVTDQASRDKFYQYSNWLYQVGVFVSRSSGNCFVAPMGLLWAMPFLQCANVALYWSIGAHQTASSSFWHSPYFLYPTALYSGLLGGAVYIHGYLRICQDLPLEHREFVLSATSLAECLGIVVADFAGLLIQACLYQMHGLEGAAMTCPTKKFR